MDGHGIEALCYEQGKTKVVAYMDLYPVGFILELDPQSERFNYVTDITNMGYEFNYNENVSFRITLNILERNTHFVGDFRSKEEIIEQINSSKAKTVECIVSALEEYGIEKEEYENVIQDYIDNKIGIKDLYGAINIILRNR